MWRILLGARCNITSCSINISIDFLQNEMGLTALSAVQWYKETLICNLIASLSCHVVFYVIFVDINIYIYLTPLYKLLYIFCGHTGNHVDGSLLLLYNVVYYDIIFASNQLCKININTPLLAPSAIPDIDPKLIWCWSTVCNAGPTSNHVLRQRYLFAVYTLIQIIYIYLICNIYIYIIWRLYMVVYF